MALLFDLDQTIIDSRIAERNRKGRRWSVVYNQISYFTLYPGVVDALTYAKGYGLKICIVTSSPSSYCKKVLDFWKIPYDQTVCYHDTSKKKPNPEPLEHALRLIECENTENAISFGDRVIDIQASRDAKIVSVACLWGSSEINALKAVPPDLIAETPQELIPIIKNFYNL